MNKSFQNSEQRRNSIKESTTLDENHEDYSQMFGNSDKSQQEKNFEKVTLIDKNIDTFSVIEKKDFNSYQNKPSLVTRLTRVNKKCKN